MFLVNMVYFYTADIILLVIDNMIVIDDSYV